MNAGEGLFLFPNMLGRVDQFVLQHGNVAIEDCLLLALFSFAAAGCLKLYFKGLQALGVAFLGGGP